ncbi:hypothetical protein HAX54_018038 [Datura stramonium]|uniref:Uncharacterized protein n=1 Tax=Datura stramonium TaxID=4076 RepID=A0ABS8Y6T0_DATST|nr:hypothetical protein [Datura stramonium]
MGDYDVVFEMDDRIHGAQIQESEVRDLRGFIEDASMVELRVAQNKLKSLVVSDGRVINTARGPEDEVIGYYWNLLGASKTHMPAIRPDVMKEGPILHRDQQLRLILLGYTINHAV